MNLWIRSRDKEKLLNIKEIYSMQNCDTNKYSSGVDYGDDREWIIYTIYDNEKTLLGIYKNKKRALEVLEEIQKLILVANDPRNTVFPGAILFEMPSE